MTLTALNAEPIARPLPARRREQAGTRPPLRARARPRTPGRVLLPGIAEDCRVLLPGIAKRKRRSSASAAKRRPLASAAKRKDSQAQAQVKRKRSQAQASRKRRQAQPASSASASKRKRRQAQPAPSASTEFCAFGILCLRVLFEFPYRAWAVLSQPSPGGLNPTWSK